MTPAPRTIAPDALAGEALHAMNADERPITALFVVDAARPATRHPAHPRSAARGGRMSVVPCPSALATAGPVSNWSPRRGARPPGRPTPAAWPAAIW